MHTPPLLVIFGPTAVGKTRLAVELALEFRGEVISADSRQFYKEISIGTAKPSTAELKGVKHHFIDSLSVSDTYSAGQFEKDALHCISDINARGRLPIVVGGSGLYIKALLEGFDTRPSDPELRERLNKLFQNNGLDPLRLMLSQLNEELYNEIDQNNHVRLIRAIEISSHARSSVKETLIKPKRPFQVFKIGLEMNRAELYQKIDRRVDSMLDSGLESEAKMHFEKRHLQAFNTVGYKELFEYMAGKYNLDRAIELIKRNSRRYAKRQLTWMRGEIDLKWFDVNQPEEIVQYVRQILANSAQIKC